MKRHVNHVLGTVGTDIKTSRTRPHRVEHPCARLTTTPDAIQNGKVTRRAQLGYKDNYLDNYLNIRGDVANKLCLGSGCIVKDIKLSKTWRI